MKAFIFLAFLPLITTFSFAQNPAENNPVNNSLDDLYQIAQTERVQIEEEIKAIRLQVKGYDGCKVEWLTAKDNYNQWFLDHYAQFKKFDIDQNVIDEKLALVQNKSVQVNPVLGNNDVVNVNFDAILKFVEIYNGRVADCSTDEARTIIEKQMELPKYNDLGMATSQIQTALDLLSNFLNQKQSETYLGYKLKILKEKYTYSIILETTLTLDGKSNQSYTFQFPVIRKAEKLSTEINTDKSWALLAKNNVMVDGKPVFGFARYFNFIKTIPQSCFSWAIDSDDVLYDAATSFSPFLTLEAWLAQNKKIAQNITVSQKIYYISERNEKMRKQKKLEDDKKAQEALSAFPALFPDGFYESTEFKRRDKLHVIIVTRDSKTYLTYGKRYGRGFSNYREGLLSAKVDQGNVKYNFGSGYGFVLVPESTQGCFKLIMSDSWSYRFCLKKNE